MRFKVAMLLLRLTLWIMPRGQVRDCVLDGLGMAAQLAEISEPGRTVSRVTFGRIARPDA